MVRIASWHGRCDNGKGGHTVASPGTHWTQVHSLALTPAVTGLGRHRGQHGDDCLHHGRRRPARARLHAVQGQARLRRSGSCTQLVSISRSATPSPSATPRPQTTTKAGQYDERRRASSAIPQDVAESAEAQAHQRRVPRRDDDVVPHRTAGRATAARQAPDRLAPATARPIRCTSATPRTQMAYAIAFLKAHPRHLAGHA